jgi:hypothetical protein
MIFKDYVSNDKEDAPMVQEGIFFYFINVKLFIV